MQRDLAHDPGVALESCADHIPVLPRLPHCVKNRLATLILLCHPGFVLARLERLVEHHAEPSLDLMWELPRQRGHDLLWHILALLPRALGALGLGLSPARPADDGHIAIAHPRDVIEDHAVAEGIELGLELLSLQVGASGHVIHDNGDKVMEPFKPKAAMLARCDDLKGFLLNRLNDLECVYFLALVFEPDALSDLGVIVWNRVKTEFSRIVNYCYWARAC